MHTSAISYLIIVAIIFSSHPVLVGMNSSPVHFTYPNQITNFCQARHALYAACVAKDVARVRQLLGSGLYNEFLFTAIKIEDTKLLELFLLYGVSVKDPARSTTYTDQETYMHTAVTTRKKEIVRLLVEHGAAIDLPDAMLQRPIDKLARALELELQANPCSEDDAMCAARSIIILLIKQGACYNLEAYPRVTGYLQDLFAFKPAHLRLATVVGSSIHVNNALVRGASPHVRGKKNIGLTALELAQLHNKEELIKLFSQIK